MRRQIKKKIQVQAIDDVEPSTTGIGNRCGGLRSKIDCCMSKGYQSSQARASMSMTLY